MLASGWWSKLICMYLRNLIRMFFIHFFQLILVITNLRIPVNIKLFIIIFQIESFGVLLNIFSLYILRSLNCRWRILGLFLLVIELSLFIYFSLWIKSVMLKIFINPSLLSWIFIPSISFLGFIWTLLLVWFFILLFL